MIDEFESESAPVIKATKKCIKCGEDKEFKEFRKQSKAKDGLHLYCKKCQDQASKESYYKSRLRRIEQVKLWQEKNTDKLKTYTDKFKHKNDNIPQG